MNRKQSDIFLQYQKGELSREEATDKILHHALKSRRWLFKHDDDDDDNDDDVMMMMMMMMGKGLKRGKNLRMKKFLIPVTYGHLKIERALIRKNIQTDKVLDLIANTTPTVA